MLNVSTTMLQYYGDMVILADIVVHGPPDVDMHDHSEQCAMQGMVVMHDRLTHDWHAWRA